MVEQIPDVRNNTKGMIYSVTCSRDITFYSAAVSTATQCTKKKHDTDL